MATPSNSLSNGAPQSLAFGRGKSKRNSSPPPTGAARLVALALLCLLAGLAPGREVSVTLLYTADIHGHLEPGLAPGSSTPSGGLLRCASLVRDIRRRETNVLLIDGGDLFQGTAVSWLTRGRVMSDAVKTMGYDALVPGNHEFDWGVAGLLDLYDRAQVPVLAANIAPADAPGAAQPWRPFLVKELPGVSVAVVGLANPLTPCWIRPRLLGGLSFEQSVSAIRRILPAVRERKPDVLVLAVHQGWREWGDDAANEINAIARAFPEFDVILGAHTHQAVNGADLHGILYLQPECHGRWLAKVTLRVDTEKHRVVGRHAELVAVGTDVRPDSALAAACAGALQAERDYLGQTLGRADAELTAQTRFPGQSQTQSLIGRAILEAVAADAVFHGALSEAGLSCGPIDLRDVWRIVPYENTIGVARLTLDEVREVLEENSRYLKTGHFRGVVGLTYELYPSQPPGARVRNIRLADGRVPPDGERIRVAFNSHDLASAGRRFLRLREIADRPGSRLEETDVDTREAVVAYIRKHSPLNESAAAGARIVRK